MEHAAAQNTAHLPDTVAELYPYEYHDLIIDGMRYHYVDEGPRDAPVLLMVHGNPTWSFYWRSLIDAFKNRFRCIAPDHIGMGLSDKPRRYPYRLADHIANLDRLIDALNLNAVTLAVHDWGGAIGMGASVRRPERFSRFIVFNSAAWPSKRIPLRIAACKLPILGPLAVRGFNAFAVAATGMTMKDPSKMTPEIKAGYLFPYRSWRDRIGVLRFVQDIPMRPAHRSYPTLKAISDTLHHVSDKPMTIVWGMADWCFTPDFLAEWRERFPHASVHEITDAGHYVVEEARDSVREIVADFLADTPL